MKVSILVAVYNGEKFVRRCLDSLVSQTYGNIEIVCIDDASKDNSAEIISDYARHDGRIKLIRHDKNKGAAEARNTGIKECSGDIIGYLDADDYYATDTIERLVKVFEAHEDADCVLYRCVLVDKDGKQKDYEGLKFSALEGREAFLESLTWNIHGVYAAKAWLWKEYPMDTTRRHFSDDNTCRIHYIKSRKVYQSDAPYYYLYNPDSISNQISTSRMDYIAASQSMKRQLQELEVGEDIMRRYETERVKILVDCYLFYYKYRNQMSKADKEYCLSELKTGWESIDARLADDKMTRKLGYNPCKKSWALFRLQEEFYFFLKKISGRL